MSKRQLNLLRFFRPAGHSDPKQARVDPADQLGASTAGISIDANCTDEAAVTVAPATGGHDNQHE